MTTDLDPRVVRRLADMHAVYRMFGHTGELLYVGKTGHLHRFDDHAVKRWFPLVGRIVLEWHDTEASARVAERRAIQTERPRYNIASNPKARRSKVTMIEAAVKESPKDAPNWDALADVLHVFGDAPGLHWLVLAERLAEHFPDRWSDATSEVVSAQCRALEVPSVCVRFRGRTARGCRRGDVEVAAAQHVIAR